MKSYLFALLAIVGFFAGCTVAPDSTSVKAVYGKTNPAPDQNAGAEVKRFASAIELLPEKEQSYRQLHADVWPEVITAVKKANIRNYSIYIVELAGKKYLFSYLEYAGDDLEKDFARLKEDPTIRDKWWPITDACQKRLPDTPKGEQWKPIEMIMHIP